MEQHDCNEYWTLFEIHTERSQNSHFFCKMLSQHKHVMLQSTAPLQLTCFKVGSKMAIAASTPVLANQKKQCCKISWFTDTPCTNGILSYTDGWCLARFNSNVSCDHTHKMCLCFDCRIRSHVIYQSPNDVILCRGYREGYTAWKFLYKERCHFL